MSDVPYEDRVRGAWIAIQEIKNEEDPEFWDQFDRIWLELRDGLQPDEDENAALEALVGFAAQAGHGDSEGFV